MKQHPIKEVLYLFIIVLAAGCLNTTCYAQSLDSLKRGYNNETI